MNHKYKPGLGIRINENSYTDAIGKYGYIKTVLWFNSMACKRWYEIKIFNEDKSYFVKGTSLDIVG